MKNSIFKSDKGFSQIVILIGIILLFITAFTYTYIFKNNNKNYLPTGTNKPLTTVQNINSALFYLESEPNKSDSYILYKMSFSKNQTQVKQILSIKEDLGQITNLIFTPNKQYLVWRSEFSHKPAFIKYLKIANEEVVDTKTITPDKGSFISNIAFSPDSKNIALLEGIRVDDQYSIDKFKIRILSLEDMKLIKEFTVTEPATYTIEGFAWSSSNRLRIIYNTPIDSLDKPSPRVNFIASSFTPDGIKDSENVIYTGYMINRPVFDISQDGENFAFVTLTDTPQLTYGDFSNSRMNKLADIPQNGDCASSNTVFISPNKKSILIGNSCISTAKGQLLNIDANSLTEIDIPISSAVWSGDNNVILARYYTKNTQNTGVKSHIYLLNSSGQIIKKIDNMFTISPVVWYP